MKTPGRLLRSIAGAVLAALALCTTVVATESENLNSQVLPAPGKVVIDGKFDDLPVWPKTWQAFGPVPPNVTAIPDPKVLATVPAELEIAGKKYAPRKVDAESGLIDFQRLFSCAADRIGAWIFAPLQAGNDVTFKVCASADWWMEWYVNGEKVYDTLKDGNGETADARNHRFKVSLKKGDNVLACRVLSGSGGFSVLCEPVRWMSMPSVFGSHMVLQSGKTVQVWGADKPGQKVVVKIGDQTADCIADQDGRWRAEIAAAKAGGPFTMTVTGSSTLTFEDVMFGEVWICSGQSNMHLGVNPMINAGTFPKEHFDLPNVRLYTAGDKKNGDSTWRVCSPEAAQIGGRQGVSQVGFYFARTIHLALNVPVGLIVAAQGYTDIETWTEGDAVRKLQQEKLKAIYDSEVEVKLKAIREWVADSTSTIANVDKEDVRKKLEAYDNKAEYSLFRLLACPVGPHVRPLNGGGGCFARYVVPMIPYQIRGVAWYQGFNNRLDDEIYYDKMKALIESWRTAWRQTDLPFFFVQQQNSGGGFIQKETQAAIMRTIPGTGMAVIQDLGAGIHPDNKNEVGRRLALWPLAKTYGKDLECSGPLYKAMTVTGDTARIEFDHAGDGLISRDGKPLRWFIIAGADRVFMQAEASIDGNTVLVRSDKVAKPEAVRYAWDGAAVDLNFFNKAGLPASCFRTDVWKSAGEAPAKSAGTEKGKKR